ncbi:MAG: hypothetical protein LBU41_03985 [Clostridiales Family XIII bacterium]|jgi:hypothetical protein|nr:hypothetical protein [Clostridiales Family XIII bacterium]
MTLIITLVAAIAMFCFRFARPEFARKNAIGVLALMYFGASVMWIVDGVANLIEGEAFVELKDATILRDDAILGGCVVALGLVAWLCLLMIKRFSASRSQRGQ